MSVLSNLHIKNFVFLNMDVKEPALAYGKHKYTIAEYLQLEEAATEKHEYYRGEIFAMSGPTVPHNIIAVNMLGS